MSGGIGEVRISGIHFIKPTDTKGWKTTFVMSAKWESHYIGGILSGHSYCFLYNLDRLPTEEWAKRFIIPWLLHTGDRGNEMDIWLGQSTLRGDPSITRVVEIIIIKLIRVFKCIIPYIIVLITFLCGIPHTWRTEVDMRKIVNVGVTWVCNWKVSESILELQLEDIVFSGDDFLSPTIHARTIIDLKTKCSRLID